MNMTPGDLADKYSILRLKVFRLEKDAELWSEFKRVEIAVLSEQGVITAVLRNRLHEVNESIWDLEAAIRAGKESSMTLEEIGKKALAIRDFNKTRVAIKNEINAVFGSPKEIKVDHAST